MLSGSEAAAAAHYTPGSVLFRTDHLPSAVTVFWEPLDAPRYTLYAEAMALEKGLMRRKWAVIMRQGLEER